MIQQAWQIRAAKPGDGHLFASFRCAAVPAVWQVEVEQFVQQRLADWAFDPRAEDLDPRVLLMFDTWSSRLIGLAAHEQVDLQDGGGVPFRATRLQVVALVTDWQGRRFSTGERASDVILAAVMADVAARVPARDARVFAVVHGSNRRSIALCRRHGLTEELQSPYPGYRRLITAHGRGFRHYQHIIVDHG